MSRMISTPRLPQTITCSYTPPILPWSFMDGPLDKRIIWTFITSI